MDAAPKPAQISQGMILRPYGITRKKSGTYSWCAPESVSSEGDNQNLQDKDARQDWEIEWRSEQAREDEELVIKFSRIEFIEESHHHKHVEAVGVMDRS